MIRSSCQRKPFLERALEKSTKLLRTGQKDGEVVETGRVPRPLMTTRQCCQAKNCRTIGTKHRMLGVAGDSGEAERFVERALAVEVEKLKLDGAKRPRAVPHAQAPVRRPGL